MYEFLRRQRRAHGCIVFGFCAYECAALVSGKVPTLTSLSRRHHWLAPVLVTGLSVHLYHDARRSA